ncbi:hypothetical protein [Photobacterium angustum]|uniref:hypothetical protein n=1 Tax=Photobacterium angustum TaxID=661 RepID=UPI0005DB129F|nr:hypothetical protein [Photobacterium angustum]KJG01698.1 hypothetical protein UB35_10855 [Photobacterium angustum]PSV65480.1 hypothetical protein CTM95_16015 [Photobacterium angustum]PSW82255.1 hypothetical protein CTN03_03545 [Photobacterium angustum]
MDWLIENKEWVFSGIGVSVVVFFLSFFNKGKQLKQSQKSGGNSKNYQAGGDIKIGHDDDK